MPEMIPVGNTIIPPNPMTGLNTLSGILGIQQQRQALTGQAALVKQAQMNTEAQQGERDFFTNWSPGDHIAADGTTDIDSAHGSQEYKSLTGLARTAVDQKLIQIKQGQIQNAQSLLGLGREGLGVFGQVLGAQAQDPDVIAGNENGKAKLQKAIADATAIAGPPGAKVAQIYSNITNGNIGNGELPKRIQAVQKAALNADRQLQITQPGGPQTQTTGGIVTPNTNIYAGPQFPMNQPVGGATPGTGAGAVAAATGAATGQVAIDNQRFGEITNAAAKSQTGIALADQVADLARQVRTGELTKEWADKLTVLKQSDPTITARQMLAKYAAQLKTTAESGAATDSERSQIEAGMPSPETMNPDAVQDAAHYLHGYFRMNQARGQNALTHVTSNGTAELTQKDTAFMQSADPFVYAFRDMNHEQQKEFLLRRYGPKGSKDPSGFASFEQRVKAQ